MSLPDRRTRRIALIVSALGAALLLGGCFRPMYASLTPGAPSMTQTLAAVEVPPVKGRIAQQVRNNLQFGLTGGGGAAAPLYKLDISVDSSRSSSIVDAITDEPQIDTILLSTSYTLYEIGKPAPILSGRLNASKSFDRTLQRFAALRAARDAENSAAKILAEHLKTRIAAFLAART
jgi:LPS-assembly lipoprotein